MGYATTRSLERVAAAMGDLESAPIEFEAAADIPEGGVLLALPARRMETAKRERVTVDSGSLIHVERNVYSVKRAPGSRGSGAECPLKSTSIRGRRTAIFV